MRYMLSAMALVLLASLTTAPLVGQQNSASTKLPPISYVCTMAGDEAVLEDKPGRCPNPKCGMELVPVRLDSKFWCPTHQTLVVMDGPGKCRLDGKDLVQVTLAEHWTCADEPDKKLLEPGRCANGQPRKINYEVRAHGDHNPRHDGQFFMAQDAWHHIEGTYPSAGLFRVFFYDNFTKPLAPKAFTGSIAVLDDKDKPRGTVPLKISAKGDTLEARIPPALAALPLKAAAYIKFAPAVPEQVFNFVFSAYSKDPVAPAAPAVTSARPPAARPAAPTTATSNAPARTAPAAPPAPSAPAPRATTPAAAVPPPAAAPVAAAQAPATSPQAPAMPEPLILDSPAQVPPALAEALDESKLPTNTQGLLAALTSRAQEVETLVNEGNLSQVWLPATGTKTVALVLDTHARSLPERQRAVVTAAVKRVVTAAWELDAYGDLGNKQKIAEAYRRLASAVTDLKAAYETR